MSNSTARPGAHPIDGRPLRSITTEVGGEERDIWYDADGQVARVTF